MAKEEIKKVGCRFCGATCGLLAHLQDGRVVKITGNPEHRLSRGFMCERPRHAVKWLYHPDQLLYPLKRMGTRGAGQWQRISTDDAIGEIAKKLIDLKGKYGPETLAFFEGTYRAENMWARSRFGNIFGNPQNVFHPGVICGLNCLAVSQSVMGDSAHAHPDIARTNCIVFSGQRPHESSPRTIASLTRRRSKGEFKIIVIDPLKTRIAEMADVHLQIRPGTDAALFLGWINVIISEQLYDSDFVERWTVGFDKLAGRAQEYPPERVSQITGIPARQVAQSARLYGMTKPACIYRGVAPDQIGKTSARVDQARAILRAITGNIDIPGGDLVAEIGPIVNGQRFVRDTDLELVHRLPIALRKKMIGYDKAPLMSWKGFELIAAPWEKMHKVPSPTIHRLGGFVPHVWEAILTGNPYPVTAAITLGGNPMMWAANTRKVHQAFTSDNLALHVVQEFWITPTAQLADYILPAASWLETPLCGTFEDFFGVVYGGERAVQPRGERMDDYLFWRKLAMAVGQDEADWPWKTLEEVIAHRIQPLGMTYEEYVQAGCIIGSTTYKKYEETGFPTQSGKVELACSLFEKLGHDPLPFYQEPPETPVSAPETAREFPFILTTGGRFMPMFHSEHRQMGIGMREKHPDPLVTIHPETAENLGINEGDWVWIETPRGRITQKAHLDAGILPNVVNCEASWWFPEKSGVEPSLFGAFDSNANMLTADSDEFCDPLTGGWTNRGLLCKVYKDKGAETWRE